MKLKNGLAILLATSACFAFVACEDEPAPAPEHEHTWATEWSKDGENHWLTCTGEDCEEIKDKAEHEWNAGEITTQPSASADGVKTYTCTVCSQTKTENVPYVVDTEVTAEEWLAALSFENEDNYKIYNGGGDMVQVSEICGATSSMKVSVDGEVIVEQIETKKENKYYSYNVGKYNVTRNEIQESVYTNNRTMGMGETFLFADFTYDPTSKTYKAETIDSGTVYTDVEVEFENGRLVAMSMTYLYMGAPVNGNVVITYGDVEEIAIPDVEITEEEWNLAREKYESYTTPKTITYNANDGSVVVVQIDGVNLSQHHIKESENIDNKKVFAVEGENYYRYTKTGDDVWTKASYEQNEWQSLYQQVVNNATPNYWANFEYISVAGNGGYYFTESGRTYTYYFIDGELSYIEVSGNTYFTIIVDFDVPTIEIPDLTVDETQMLAAFADAKNDAISKRVTFSLGGDTMVFITNADKYSYSMPNVSEYVFVIDGLKTYSREYDEGTGAWEAWTVNSSNNETSFMQSYEYMHKPNLFLKYYAPTSFATMTQAQDGGYEYTIAGNDAYDSYKVYFINGKLTKFVAYDGGDAITLIYEYGDYTVEIPQEQ